MMRCLPVALWLAAAVPAQDQIALPRLLRLGPLPQAATTLQLTADGVVCDTDAAVPAAAAAAIDLAALRRLLAKKPQPLLLQVDRQVPFAVVDAVLACCRDADLAEVQFAAVLPDGKAGAFLLALPERGEVATTLELRLHRERPGVPPASATPLLQRLQRGGAGAKASAPFALGVEAPGDAPFEQVLQALAAVAAADVQRVALRAAPTAAQQARLRQPQDDLTALAHAAAAAPALALAIDLGPALPLQVEPRALPAPSPTVLQSRFGCRQRAEAGPAPAEVPGGAGGRYGGRVGGRPLAAMAASAEAIARANRWLTAQQAADGSFADASAPGDVTGTALALLAFLGDGSTLRSGSWSEPLRKGIGWLLAQQQADGSIGEGVRAHALASYALAEAYGLSQQPLLLGPLEDALGWLAARQRPDGGFGDGKADVGTTAVAVTAAVSAMYFGLQPRVDLAAVAGWFDAAKTETDADKAAMLFSRFFLEQNPKQQPAMVGIANQLVAADAADPLGAYWTTYALYQMGGPHWAAWSRQLPGMTGGQASEGDARGSWAAAAGGSRLQTTALRALTLESYYRYSRLVR